MSKIIDKIKKLMALSKSHNANEAALALNKARELMNVHNISASEISMENIQQKPVGIRMRSKVPPNYVMLLAESLEQLFQCSSWWNSSEYFDRNSKKQHRCHPVFIGTSPNQEICAYTFEVLYNKLIKARRTYRPLVRGRYAITIAKDSFATGWVNGVYGNIRHLIPERPMAEVVGETGLIKVDALEAYVKDHVKGSFETKEKGRDYFSELLGHKEGSKVQVNKGMNNSKNSTLAIA